MVGGDEHFPGLADAWSGAQKYFETAALLAFETREQRCS
jgi:hypothetical protein